MYHRKWRELPDTAALMQTGRGSFDCADRFASESACFAQDDRKNGMTGSKTRMTGEEVAGIVN
jgi:hypothetical protein